jgi:hypothetical protein
MQPLPKSAAVSEKIYRKLLRLYPEQHRREFGEPMAQLFRDQCRDAWMSGRHRGLAKLWLRTLPDFGKTCTAEQMNKIERNIMKYMNGKSAPTLLLIAGLLLALLSFSPFVMPFHGGFMLLVLASALTIFAKACVEFIRPADECARVLLRTLILMFCYAMFMPAWAKMKLEASGQPPLGNDPLGLILMACLFANPLVMVIKILQFFVHRRKS